MKGSYYYEHEYPDPFPNLFEAGNAEEGGYEEARPLGYCRFGVPARRTPSGSTDCERPAIAKVIFGDKGDGLLVCYEHLEKIREQAENSAECTCTWEEPDYDAGEYDWQHNVADDCVLHSGEPEDART